VKLHLCRIACRIALLVPFLVVLAGVAPADAQTPTLTIASKNFPGAEVLSQVWGQALAAGGAHVTFAARVGPTETVFPALQAGTYDAYADYQGTLLTYLGGVPTANANATHAALVKHLAGTGIAVSDAAPAIDVNGFYVSRKTAAKLHLTKVSDLRKVAPRLTIGAPPECPTRPLCLGSAAQNVYGLHFKRFVPFDPGTSATQNALQHGDIDVAVLFTGSSAIPKNTVLLRDDKGLQPADNPVLLVRAALASSSTMGIVNRVAERITTSEYNAMSLALSRQAQDPTDVAARFLAAQHLP
jgi:osmoprotectant transport system substrate-binding protein